MIQDTKGKHKELYQTMAGLSDLDGSIIEDSPEEMTFQLKSEQQVKLTMWREDGEQNSRILGDTSHLSSKF